MNTCDFFNASQYLFFPAVFWFFNNFLLTNNAMAKIKGNPVHRINKLILNSGKTGVNANEPVWVVLQIYDPFDKGFVANPSYDHY